MRSDQYHLPMYILKCGMYCGERHSKGEAIGGRGGVLVVIPIN